ncbi:hemopexin repeat-containing protein [Lentzea sp. HUAS TT2]|uniref:Tc toxin subunit A-related protein n=1 Tax=Lentzea sp. HUAS TT2 TaxID=3447454 RepID=UPI003F6F6423
MLHEESAPDYEDLFGEAENRPDDARSVYSPAAYLVDLLAMLETDFAEPSLLGPARRPDLLQVPLDEANTLTETPYLDIVNSVLEGTFEGDDPYEQLLLRKYPFVLPFSLSHARIATYLRHLEVTPLELYRLFAPRPDHDIAAREYLGMSPAEVAEVLRDDEAVPADFGLDGEKLLVLKDAERLAEALGLTGEELRALVAVTPPASISSDGSTVDWGADGAAWLTRARKLVRMSLATGLALPDLGLAVNSCCAGRIDEAGLRTLAVVLRLHRVHGLAVTDSCRMAVPIEPEEVQGCSGDLLAVRNKDYLSRLAGWIEVAETDIGTIVRRYRERHRADEPSPFDRGGIGLPEIGLLHRTCLVAGALGIGMDELFDVLTALDSDPSARRYTTFPVLGEIDPARRDVFAILAGGAPAESLWLVQTLFEVVGWMQAAGFGGAELALVLGGGQDSGEDGGRALAGAIGQAFGAVAFGAEAFAGSRFEGRAATVVSDVLAAYDDGVVSSEDDRLLRLDQEVVVAAAYDAVTDLGVIVPEDFAGLGLGDRMQAKIFGNLVLLGHLRADGTLAGEVPEDLLLATDFDDHREELFKAIGAVADTSAAFFPADLAVLETLTPRQRAELYDNLVHHGHVADSGELADPGFFADPANIELFAPSVDLSDAQAAVRAELVTRTVRFADEPFTVDAAVFAGLGFSSAQVTALVESLVFNGHLNENGAVRDKTALVDLRAEDFGLGLEFYPKRRAVLDAIRISLRRLWTELHTFTADDFAVIADETVCRRVVAALDGRYTREQRIVDEALFARPFAGLDLGTGFLPADQEMVFHRIGAVLDDQRPYRVDPAAVTALGFTDEDRDRLLAHLVAAGHLTDGFAVVQERLPYFGEITSAYDFELPGLTDYSKDVFFLLHAVAVETTAAVTEIADLLVRRAGEQELALHGVVADAFGIATATAAAICEAMTGGPAETLDLLVAPVLAAGGPPDDPRFRLAHRRIRRFAVLAAKLGLTPAEVTAVFTDQDLVGKFPENLVLPPGVRRFDALLEAHDGTVLVFAGAGYWTYAAGTRALISPASAPLSDLSPAFAGLTGVDAAFTLPSGVEWVAGHTADGTSRAFTREPGSTRWVSRDQVWGKVRNTFADPERIDGAYVDADGRTHLFCGDQYIRYSTPDYTHVDEGYPRPIAEWREREGVGGAAGPLDAFQAPDGHVHVLTGATGWGALRNAFERLERIDAAHVAGSAVQLYAGDQVVRYSDSIENDGVRADEGYPRRVHDVPARFEGGVEAAFTDADGVLHLFKAGMTAAVTAGGASVVPTAQRWGVPAPVLPSGRVDAALAGLDGRTYLFSGGSYLRYSSANYSTVDVGYPRAVESDWGGISTVDAAFVMENRTYVFGVGGVLFDLPLELQDDVARAQLTPALRNRFAEHGLTPGGITGSSPQWTLTTEQGVTLTVALEGLRMKVRGDGARYYVRYSTNDYRTPDAGFPKLLSDNWWNMPEGVDPGPVDAVFTGRDHNTYLFAGDRFLRFDARHRWWSPPMSLREEWDSVPFDEVDAAFVGHDGRTYLFSGDRYVRYSTDDYTRVDDGYPATVSAHWGKVRNNIERTGRVDAALVTRIVDEVDGVEVRRDHTYLFSGDQYFRYRDNGFEHVEAGYPRLLRDLVSEPGLSGLDVALDGVDAAFADRRTTYLFRDGQCHAVSASAYRRYDDLDLADVSCAFVEGGSVIAAHREKGWVKRSAIEAPQAHATSFRPRTLRAVPPEFQSGVDSVLMGTDGNVYVFKGSSCFDTQLDRAYPLAAEWGRPRNAIHENSRVDAAFAGRDGKTYLFSDDQFVVCAGPDSAIEGDPLPISAHWAGLTSVAIAYVVGDRTVLVEHPGEDGRARRVQYSGTDYRVPDPGYPVVEEIFPDLPAGLPFPDAVLVEGDTLILLAGERCVSRTERTGRWSVVRPIERLFPGFGHGLDSPDGLRAAFTAHDGATYFFFDRTFARFADGAFGPQEPTRDRWGLSGNPFITAGRGIDAAFVWRGEVTYLFSGDRFVRYTGSGYRSIDPGYPRRIADELRLEEPFAALPESFADELDRPLDAVVGNDRTIHVIVGGVCHTVSTALTATFPIDRIGRVRNTIAESGVVDAALVADGRVYLFGGDQYVRYSSADFTHVDDGYPRPIEAIATELDIPALPVAFQDGVDAAFRGPDGRTRLFRGRQFVVDGEAHPVKDVWGKVRNAFDAGRLDAAVVAPTGHLYAFAGGQFVRYPAGEPFDFVEPGFPRTVRDDWGDLPAEFEAGPDGAFGFEGRTYLTKADRYVRYSGGYDEVDRTFPQEFRHRWAGTADYRLTDVHTIVRFTELVRSRPEGLESLLVDGADDPYEYLAGLFGWDVADVRWAQRNSGLLVSGTTEEIAPGIEFLLALVDAFAVAGRFGTGPRRLYDEVWSQVHGQGDPAAAASALLRLVEARTAPQEWPKLRPHLHDQVNVLKRDALVAAVAPGPDGVQELFRRFLIDAGTGPTATTSRVREAIAAAQLFVHRYLLDLEDVVLRPRPDESQADPDDVRARLKSWWTWMRNYRTWEANRKVFLYPENYLRPELRDRKTPAFAALEDDLLQKEVTAESVRAAYKRYLDEYTEVSRLTIAGGYVYTEDDAAAGARKLVLFGRTRTQPHRYYYRAAQFRDGETLSTAWEPWERVDLAIDADRVDPVHAFGRVFVFWPVVEAVTPDTTATTVLTEPVKGGGQKVTAPPPKYRIKICYSFRNLNQEWVPAQLLAVSTRESSSVSELRLHVKASRTVPGGDSHDSILVQCSYRDGDVRENWATTLTPELYGLPATGTVVTPPRLVDPTYIFAEPIGVPAGSPVPDPAAIVQFNAPVDSTDGPWLSIDHKGGSFLCRPIVAPALLPAVRPLKNNPDNLPTSLTSIDAAFELPDGTRYYFDNSGPVYVVVPPDKNATRLTKRPTAERFGLSGTVLSRTGRLDAAIRRGDHMFLFTGDEYYRCHKNSFPRPDEGYPKKLATNDDNLPRWSRVDAAVVQGDGRVVFYSREHHGLVSDADLGRTWEVGQRGKAPADADVQLLQDKGELYLVFGAQYAKIDKSGAVGGNYPRALAGNPDGLPQQAAAGPSFVLNGVSYWFDNAQRTFLLRAGGDTTYPTRTFFNSSLPARTGRVDAAYVEDGRLYLVSGSEYLRYTLDENGAVPDGHDDGYPKPLGGPVSAVINRGHHRYVFDGAEYGALPIDAEPDSVVARRPIAGNWEGLPAGFPGNHTGTLETASALYLFTSDGYLAYPKDSPAPRETIAVAHEVIRLTSSTAFELNRRLLVGGIEALLAPDTQELDELPAFSAEKSDATTIRVQPETAKAGVPVGAHLDFDSANGLYYWEIFFHAPMLIAQALNGAQRFEEARRWVEHVFDPTVRERPWRFLPFHESPDRDAVEAASDRAALLEAYRDDPFDPHAIAQLRPESYRRATVMSYVDNLLDWGDLLFRQYTAESVDEARMLYIFAYDLLGKRPYDLGPRLLPGTSTYDKLDEVAGLTLDGVLLEGSGAVHAGVADPYFHVPGNSVFLEYWNRVEDRLGKIRASMDILGISRPLPLFAPPADVASLVRAAASGASIEQVVATTAASVPAYRFTFLHRAALDLTDRCRQLGSDLLAAFDRRDTEELALLQNRQEAAILALTREVKLNQIEAAQETLRELQAAQAGAGERIRHYEHLIGVGASPLQIAQLTAMSAGAASHFAASGLKIAAAAASAGPQNYIGPFIAGTSWGSDQLGEALDKGSEVAESLGEGLSMLGEVFGARAEQLRQEEDWRLQLATSRADAEQIGHQVLGAELQVGIARQELAVLDRQAAHLGEVTTFLTGKFAGHQLYGWMATRLSGLYFQTYHLAYELARSAEKAYHFERGTEDAFVQPTHWDSHRNGLLAAEALAADLGRLGQAYTAGAGRNLEITKRLSLVELDPMALLALRGNGTSEFTLSEDLYDRDFPGHYRRQIRTVSVTFETADGPIGVPATLTQLDNKIVLAPDPKAVRYLLDPKGTPPESLRGDWRPSRQIALSDVEDGRENNGMFELRYDDDLYLPFEGTGAVSRWRLTARRVPTGLLDVTITVKYTAEQGGETFGTAVSGMLRPRPAARYLDVATEFPNEWAAFTGGDTDRLPLPITPGHLPGITGRQITGVHATYGLATATPARFLLNGDTRLALDNGQLLNTPGLTTGDWTLVHEGGPVTGLGLILTYRAGAQ